MSEDKRYMLYPGTVSSKNDGDIHYIGASRLAQLYGVPLAECIVARHNTEKPPVWFKGVCLHPRYHGDYTLPGRVE